MPPVCCARREAKRNATLHSGVWSTMTRNFRRLGGSVCGEASLMCRYRARLDGVPQECAFLRANFTVTAWKFPEETVAAANAYLSYSTSMRFRA